MRYAFMLPVYLVFVAEGGAAVVRMVSHVWRAADLKFAARAPDHRSGTSSSAAWYVLCVAALIVISVLYLPAGYRQAKTGWREAADYLAAHTRPGDVIVTDPVFDARRYLDYYYNGPAELATPAVLVASLPGRTPGMRASGGRVWAVTRFEPRPMSAIRLVEFPGLVVSEPLVPVYEPDTLTAAMISLMQQAVEAAPGWAARMSAQGVMDPDPHVARAAAYLYLGDVLRVAGRLPEAIAAYEAKLADDPDPAAGYVTLAETYQAAGRLEAAVRTYQQAVVRQPKWQGSDAEAAAALAQAGRWAEAAAAYQEVVQEQREP